MSKVKGLTQNSFTYFFNVSGESNHTNVDQFLDVGSMSLSQEGFLGPYHILK